MHSERPLNAELNNSRHFVCRRWKINRRWGKRKYPHSNRKGRAWEIPVAQAAPAMPHPKRAMNR